MTQLLLDTNVVLWLSQDNPRISDIKPLLLAEEVCIFISSVSWWEIAIKVRIGKLRVDLQKLLSMTKKYGYLELPMTSAYLQAYLELPLLHKDPFDHMILAQAMTCPMRLITGDAILAEYSPLVMTV